jgi:hypothetical protein
MQGYAESFDDAKVKFRGAFDCWLQWAWASAARRYEVPACIGGDKEDGGGLAFRANPS